VISREEYLEFHESREELLRGQLDPYGLYDRCPECGCTELDQIGKNLFACTNCEWKGEL